MENGGGEIPKNGRDEKFKDAEVKQKMRREEERDEKVEEEGTRRCGGG